MAEAAHALPAGTVTFLRSDIEGSMRLARALGRRYDEVNAEHQEIVRSAIVAHGGREVRTEGDAFFVVFSDASAAVQAAVAIQRAISAHEWPADADVRVRIGVHAGSAYLAGDDYGGFEVNRAARIAALGSGGQIVLSDPARALVADDLPPGTSIRVLGRHRLKDVPQPEALFQLDVAGLPTTFPALRSTDRPAGNLVARLTSFVGRDNELRRLTELLETRRLITLTGPGGTGKTSLAIEVARNASGDFPDGTWLVDLASVHDPALAKPTIARTLGLFDGTEGPAADRLGTYLADRTALLVLDNFEQILAAAPEVSAILRVAPHVKAIVSSRAPLRVAGEQEVPIGPLPLGDGDGADGALGLFLDRARAVWPDFRLGPAETSAVAEICTLLDGLPLGLELAAARVSAMPVTAIRDRLAARLPLPGTAPRDLPDRQRTLDDAIAWSYALLEPAARRVFDAIGVFEGSFDVEQAEVVCGAGDGVEPDVLGSIVVLAEQSLLTPVSDGTSGMRYRAFETTRAFALGRLRAAGEEDAIRERHAAAYLALGEAAAPSLPGGDQARWLDRLAADDANLRAATEWLIRRRDVDRAFRMVAALWRYWVLSGRLHDGRGLVDAAFALPGADRPTVERMRAYDASGGIAYWSGDSARATALYDEQLEVARSLGDRAGIANAAFNLGHPAFYVGDSTRAAELLATAKQGFRALGQDGMLARIDWVEATMLLREGRLPAARSSMESSLRRFEASGDVWYAGMAKGSLAWMDAVDGNFRSAMRWATESLILAVELRDVADITLNLQTIAIFAERLDRPTDGAIMKGAFDGLCSIYGVLPPAGLEFLTRLIAEPAPATTTALGQEAYEAAYAQGAHMTVDEAVDYALALAASLEPDADANRAADTRR